MAERNNIDLEIAEAYKQQQAMMKILNKSAASFKKTRSKRNGTGQKGGFLSSMFTKTKDLSTLAVCLVMIFKGKSHEVVGGYVEKHGSNSFQQRLVSAGKEAMKEEKKGLFQIEGSVRKRSDSKRSYSKRRKTGGSGSESKRSASNRSESDRSESNRSKSNRSDSITRTSVYTGDRNEKGEMHGTGRLEYSKGHFYEGEFKNNQRDGKGKITFVDKSSYEGDWSKNRMTGDGKYSYFNGDVYEGNIVEGERRGFGQMTYANGDVYEGNWKKNRRHGEGKMHYKNGNEFVGHWYKDLREGKGRLTDWTGKVLEDGEYEDDHAPFNLTTVGTAKSKVTNFLGSVGKNIDEVVNSDESKKVQKAFSDFKESLPEVPDEAVATRYAIYLVYIFSGIGHMWSGKSCDITDFDSDGYLICQSIQLAYSAMKLAADKSWAITTQFYTWFGYLFGFALAGILLLVLYGSWQYINAPRDDQEKSNKTRRKR